MDIIAIRGYTTWGQWQRQKFFLGLSPFPSLLFLIPFPSFLFRPLSFPPLDAWLQLGGLGAVCAPPAGSVLETQKNRCWCIWHKSNKLRTFKLSVYPLKKMCHFTQNSGGAGANLGRAWAPPPRPAGQKLWGVKVVWGHAPHPLLNKHLSVNDKSVV